MKERRAPQPVVARCKLVLVGDVQCGKTAMLQVLAKDCYPEVSCAPSPSPTFLLVCLRLCPGVDSHLPGGNGAASLFPTSPHPILSLFLAGEPPCLSFPLRPVPLLPPRWLLLTSSPIGPNQIPSYLPSFWSQLSGEGPEGI